MTNRLSICFLLLLVSLPVFADSPAVAIAALLPRFSATTLKSTDKLTGNGASIPTKASLGFEFDWSLSTERVQWFLYADGDYSTLSVPSNKTLDVDTHFLVGGGMGVGVYPFSSRNFLVSLVHSYHPQLFFRATSSSALVVDRILIPALELRMNMAVYRGSQLSVSVEGTGASYFSMSSGGQNFRNGWGAMGRVLASYDLGGSTQLLGGPGYNYLNLQTELVDQTRSDIYGTVGFLYFLD